MNKKLIVIVAVVVILGVGFLLLNRKQEGINQPTGEIPTSADNAPPGSIHNLPIPPAVSAVKKYVAEKEGVGEGLVIVLTAYEKEWSDGCLGLGGPAESCLAAITPGYEVTVQVRGTEQKYRTNTDGSQIRRGN